MRYQKGDKVTIKNSYPRYSDNVHQCNSSIEYRAEGYCGVTTKVKKLCPYCAGYILKVDGKCWGEDRLQETKPWRPYHHKCSYFTGYRRGHIVKIRSDLELGEVIDGNEVTALMMKYRGFVAPVQSLWEEDKYWKKRIQLANLVGDWTIGMFETTDEKLIPTLITFEHKLGIIHEAFGDEGLNKLGYERVVEKQEIIEINKKVYDFLYFNGDRQTYYCEGNPRTNGCELKRISINDINRIYDTGILEKKDILFD